MFRLLFVWSLIFELVHYFQRFSHSFLLLVDGLGLMLLTNAISSFRHPIGLRFGRNDTVRLRVGCMFAGYVVVRNAMSNAPHVGRRRKFAGNLICLFAARRSNSLYSGICHRIRVAGGRTDGNAFGES